MSNPFEPPKADIQIQENIEDNRLGWKMFFLLMLAFEIFGFYDLATRFAIGDYDIADVLGIVVYPLVLIALYGYAFKKAFFHQIVWKILFPVSLLTDAISLYLVITSGDDFANSLALVSVLVVILVPLFVFQYMALYRYGFTRIAPWDKHIK